MSPWGKIRWIARIEQIAAWHPRPTPCTASARRRARVRWCCMRWRLASPRVSPWPWSHLINVAQCWLWAVEYDFTCSRLAGLVCFLVFSKQPESTPTPTHHSSMELWLWLPAANPHQSSKSGSLLGRIAEPHFPSRTEKKWGAWTCSSTRDPRRDPISKSETLNFLPKQPKLRRPQLATTTIALDEHNGSNYGRRPPLFAAASSC
jgi:hypothetical protein